MFRPKYQQVGSKLAPLNIPGATLIVRDCVTVELERERLDGEGISRVDVRVANVLPYTVLNRRAFQDRHENKDAYDLIFSLLVYPGGPAAAGEAAPRSPHRSRPAGDRSATGSRQGLRGAWPRCSCRLRELRR